MAKFSQIPTYNQAITDGDGRTARPWYFFFQSLANYVASLTSSTLAVATSQGTTSVNLQTSGVTAGTYVYPQISVDKYGRVLSAATGTITSSTLVSTTTGANTDIELASTAVTAGSYTLASLTVDKYGRLTAASTNTLTSTTLSVSGTDIELPTQSSSGSYTYASLTVDGYGRVTAASNGTAPASSANPTGTVGLSAVNGSATTYMRSDAAPPLSQSIAPTWTGAHTFGPSSGTGITVNGNSSATQAVSINAGTNQYAEVITGNGSAFATKIIAGSGAAGLYIGNTPGAGTAGLRIDTAATTGAKTATFSASNKPGTNNQTTPSTWLPINLDGTLYYIPCFAA